KRRHRPSMRPSIGYLKDWPRDKTCHVCRRRQSDEKSMANPSHQASGIDPAPANTPATMVGLDFLKRLSDGSHPAPAFAAATDISIVEAEHGRVLFAAMPSKRFYNPLGAVHGGWIATLLDSAMGCAVHSVLAVGQTYTTVDMTVSFVRPVVEQTG